ncbi:HAD-IA family hydrolase [Candidatus Micrarchaeota archaeon]|nr:HAD-IA family hydrolase [Candidatus Micrarchaeota archaeon]
MIRAIAFDIDNSILDFRTFKEKTAQAAAKAIVKHGLNADPKKVYKQIFDVYDSKGIEYQKTFADVLSTYNLTPNDFERAQQAGIQAYLKTKFTALKAYPGVRQTILNLKKKGIIVGVVSDAPRNKAWQRLVLTDLDDLFDFVITHHDSGKLKPDPLPFQLFLKEANRLAWHRGQSELKPQDVLFVGDNPERDTKGAKDAGFKTALAEYGWVLEKSSKVIPDYFLKRFTEIERIING